MAATQTCLLGKMPLHIFGRNERHLLKMAKLQRNFHYPRTMVHVADVY